MKDWIKLISVIVSGIVAAAIPFSAFYFAWSWCIDQVPVGLEWAGLAKVGITLVMVMIGGGATVGLAIAGGVLAAGFVAHIID